MTEPTDAELTECYKAANGEDVGKAQPLTTQRIFRAMRAAIAKWGTPPAVAGEPVAEFDQQRGRLVILDGAPMFKHRQKVYTTPQPTQAQAGAVPLTDEEVLDAFCHTPGIYQFVQAFRAGVRFAEQHHGIKGGQHGL